jgi:hypothetical protein
MKAERRPKPAPLHRGTLAQSVFGSGRSTLAVDYSVASKSLPSVNSVGFPGSNTASSRLIDRSRGCPVLSALFVCLSSRYVAAHFRPRAFLSQ